MKAIVKIAKGYGNIEIRDIEKPAIKEDEVLVEIKAAGICGSDLHHYETGEGIAIPVVLGHEFSGDLVQIGRQVKGWKIGDKVVSETHAYACYDCPLCRTGSYHLCKERKGFGSSVNGAFTQYLAVPARLLHRKPENLSYPEATILQPAADIANAVITNSHLKPGDTIVVLGPGPMGLLTVEIARASGAAKIIVVGLEEDGERLEIAKKVGADIVVNNSKEDLIGRVKEITKGKGADVVFEVTGAKPAFLQGLKVLAQKGQMTVIGVHQETVELPIRPLQRAEQSILGSTMSTWIDYERAIQLAETGRIQLKPLVTDILPLTEWKKGFELALSKKACKVIFTPVG